MNYKHTQIGYLMIVVTLAVLVLFTWVQIMARAEPPSTDSGTNLLVTATMALILFILASFGSLQVTVDEKYLQIKFGYGVYKKKFSLNDVTSAKTVKNHWYYGWGIRGWLWPKMWIYNVSGFDAVEIKLKNGKIYRIGTDEPKKLEQVILHSMEQDIKENKSIPSPFAQTYFHGTKADLKVGDLIEVGKSSNYGQRKNAKYIFLTATLDAAIWGTELAYGEGRERIYLVEPMGAIEDDPDLTDRKFPGNPTKSFRSTEPFKVVGEITIWQGHSIEQVKVMKQHIERLKEQGIGSLND